MSTIHSLSSILALPEFDIFGVPPTQLMVESDIQTEHRPISVITNSTAPIEFEIHTGLDEYINLSKSELYICLKIHLKKTNLAVEKELKSEDWKNIAPINYFLNTMFKQVMVTIGQTVVTSSSYNYPYVSYLDALINIPPEAKHNNLQTAFWHKDISGKMDEINSNRSIRIQTVGSKLGEGCELEMYGNLHLDLGSQLKSLLGGITLKIALYPHDPKFYLMYDKYLEPTVEILDARLYVHRSKLCPQVVIAHNKALEQANARYFIIRKEVKNFIIPKGCIDSYLNNVENGVLPRKLYVGLVSNEAFNGNSGLNPFFFKNYSVRHIACYLDGTQFPNRPYTPDFETKKFIREYYSLYETANQLKDNINLDITREEFNDGFTLFGFNFSPDLSDGLRSGYVSQIKRGNLRIEIKFNQALIETVTAIVFCEYDNNIEIPNTRLAIKDFN